MLGRMFSGDLPSDRDDQGHVFIDRDGPTFRWVLNHVRGSRALPDTAAELDLLVHEASFFCLPDLEAAARAALTNKRKVEQVPGALLTLLGKVIVNDGWGKPVLKVGGDLGVEIER
mmetsp:Transcript_123129/g.230173  ORF Transcript_123129/g.230173 Transcript_123129/m.230173 type:complete len:116 (-) Transcript_123129:34-381(-)